MRQILVPGHQHVEPGRFRGCDQGAVGQRVPLCLEGGDDFVTDQDRPQTDRHVGVKQETWHAIPRRRGCGEWSPL